MSAIALARRPAWGSPVAILATVSLVAWTGISVMAPLLPLFAQELHASPVELGLSLSLFAFSSMIGSAVAGLMIDRRGILLFLAGGMVVYGLGHLLIAGADSVTQLLVYRAIGGFGSGATLVGTRTYVANISDRGSLASVNGIVSSAEAAGRAIGPIIGGVLASLLSLRAPFIAVGLTSAVAVVLSFRLPRQAAPAAATSEAAAPAARLPAGFLTLLLVAQFFLLAGYGGVFTIYPPFTVQQLHWPVLWISLLVSAFGLGAIVLGPPLCRLADRKLGLSIACGSLLAIALWLQLTLVAAPVVVIFGLAFAAGGGFSAFNGVWYAMLMASVGDAHRARVMGLVLAASQLGVIAGATASTFVWQTAGIAPGLGIIVATPVLATVAMLATIPKRLGAPAS